MRPAWSEVSVSVPHFKVSVCPKFRQSFLSVCNSRHSCASLCSGRWEVILKVRTEERLNMSKSNVIVGVFGTHHKQGLSSAEKRSPKFDLVRLRGSDEFLLVVGSVNATNERVLDLCGGVRDVCRSLLTSSERMDELTLAGIFGNALMDGLSQKHQQARAVLDDERNPSHQRSRGKNGPNCIPMKLKKRILSPSHPAAA